MEGHFGLNDPLPTEDGDWFIPRAAPEPPKPALSAPAPETPLSCLGSAVSNIEDALHSDADNAALKSAAWWIREAIQRLSRGDALNPHRLDIAWANHDTEASS